MLWAMPTLQLFSAIPYSLFPIPYSLIYQFLISSAPELDSFARTFGKE